MLAGISTTSRSKIEAATEQLARGRILGRRGFGQVYSGVWRGRECAIKVLDAVLMQGTKEFLKEVNMLGIFRHQHLVPLLAFSISSEDIGRFFEHHLSSHVVVCRRCLEAWSGPCDALVSAA